MGKFRIKPSWDIASRPTPTAVFHNWSTKLGWDLITVQIELFLHSWISSPPRPKWEMSRDGGVQLGSRQFLSNWRYGSCRSSSHESQINVSIGGISCYFKFMYLVLYSWWVQQGLRNPTRTHTPPYPTRYPCGFWNPLTIPKIHNSLVNAWNALSLSHLECKDFHS